MSLQQILSHNCENVPSPIVKSFSLPVPIIDPMPADCINIDDISAKTLQERVIINGNLHEITPEIVSKYWHVLPISDPDELSIGSDLISDGEIHDFDIVSSYRIKNSWDRLTIITPEKDMEQKELNIQEIIALLPKGKRYSWVTGHDTYAIPSLPVAEDILNAINY